MLSLRTDKQIDKSCVAVPTVNKQTKIKTDIKTGTVRCGPHMEKAVQF